MTDIPPDSDLETPRPLDMLPETGVDWIGPTLRWFAILIGVLILLVVGVRLGARTELGSALATRLAEGATLGPLGRLHIEGLKGDIFSDFSLSRLEIIDDKGPWLDAHDITLRWSSTELAARRLHVRFLQAARITVLRQPVIKAQPPGGKSQLPFAIFLDQVRVRIETRPEISVRPGLWDVEAQARVHRNGSAEGLIRAASRLHFGDGLAARFRIGEKDRVELRAEAIEAAGGALAGALGLPADEPFSVHADADGAIQAGKLRIATRSGKVSPLTVDASWGKDGASLDAHALLSASRLTGVFAERIGPEAHLTIASRRRGGDDYLTDTTLNGAFAQLVAHGPVNMKLRRADGVDLSISVDELSRWWVPVPHIGATRIHGLLTGTLDRFTYKADAVGEKLTQNDYVLPRFSGPMTFTHVPGDFRLVADLKGEGGAGDGLLGLLLGARPLVHMDGGRIADGRYIFHQMKIDGTNLKLEGLGGWGLFGQLEFNGQAVITNIGLGRAGHGTLTGRWNAAEPKGAKVWNLSFDAKGQTLTTGASELDRLIGPAPKLIGRGQWTDRGLQVDKVAFNGAALTADMHGLLDREGGLAFDMLWSAVGPFGVGPVEIAGAGHGTGRISGAVTAPRADLESDLTSVDFGRLVVKPARLNLTFVKADHEVDGLVSVSGMSNFGPAVAKSGLRFVDGGVELRDAVADAGGLKLAGSVTLKDQGASAADLSVSVTSGAFLSTGRVDGALKLTGDGAAAMADLSVSGKNFALPGMTGVFRQVGLTAKGPLTQLPFKLTAQANNPFAWSFDGSGVYVHSAAPDISFVGGGKIRKADYRLLETARLRISDRDRLLRLKIALSGGQAEINAQQQGGAVSAQVKATGISLQGLTEDYLGVVGGTLTLDGRGARLQGDMEATLEGARSRDAPAEMALNAHIKVGLAEALMKIEADATNANGLKSDLTLDIPAEAAADPFRIALDRTKPVRGRFNADGELRPLWDLLAGGDRSLSGKVSAHGALSGPLNHLRATGDAALSGGAFRDAASGLSLKDLTVAATFNEGEVDVRSLSGSDGHGGQLKGDGRVSLSADGASTLKLNLTRFQLLDNEIGKAQASGSVTVTRDANGAARLAGALVVDRADIAANPPTPSGVVPLTVREVHLAPREGQDAPQPRNSPIQVAFDVAIKATRGIFVRGKGLDAELSLDSHVGGDSIRPDLTGAARLIRGTYDFSGKRFDFDELGTVRLGTTPETIRLDLTARRIDTSLTALIKVSGTAAKPEITLTSTPILPQDEILARVLFGVSASQLSGFEAAQLASALTSLATGGGFDVIGGLRQFARLDRLSLGVDQSTVNLPGAKQATTISGGKYLTDNVYVELTGGGRTGPSAQVEVRVQRNLSVISQVGSQGDASLSVRFRQNY